MANLNELLKDLAEVDVEMDALRIRRYELLRQARPLAMSQHRTTMRGAAWAYVTRSFAGNSLPRYGQRVRIVRSMERSAIVGWKRADVDFEAEIAYVVLSTTQPDDKENQS